MCWKPIFPHPGLATGLHLLQQKIVLSYVWRPDSRSTWIHRSIHTYRPAIYHLNQCDTSNVKLVIKEASLSAPPLFHTLPSLCPMHPLVPHCRPRDAVRSIVFLIVRQWCAWTFFRHVCYRCWQIFWICDWILSAFCNGVLATSV